MTSKRLYPHQREIIEQVFACPVANAYGGRDAGFIAHECPEGGRHITSEDIIVEIIGNDGNPLPVGEAGEIKITHLATHDFPFIRYRTGDIGALSDERCRCGRGLPLLKEIRGRTTDFVVDEDGTVIHGLALFYVLRDMKGVESFKIIQLDLEHTLVQVVAGKKFDSEVSIQKITTEFKKRQGKGVEIGVEFVDEIPKVQSGKFRSVISHVNP
ncbi:phenylacetate--CoA ligase family protein, partial [Methylotuvimicrobium alcaliphilum]|uniref:CapK protein n=1 Tax=Methylotuvimicrobium alcaliphilum (strain DSM 19304 / NCIMB 14124 / VKM B-2133 / 20Z) TaxID=1091494 RepID=G4SYV7_META2